MESTNGLPVVSKSLFNLSSHIRVFFQVELGVIAALAQADIAIVEP